jgi:hypothetical protein
LQLINRFIGLYVFYNAVPNRLKIVGIESRYRRLVPVYWRGYDSLTAYLHYVSARKERANLVVYGRKTKRLFRETIQYKRQRANAEIHKQIPEHIIIHAGCRGLND